ncbi:MAG: ribosomal protein S18-alanine N-acetyltransferase [Clostridia bacterium]|nr:ribosomal protein S18-alanine N-acetyltransferase [Clostridia bacterium]
MKKCETCGSIGNGLCLAYAEACDVPMLAEAERACFPNDPWNEGTLTESLSTPSLRAYILYNTQTSNLIGYGIISLCLDEGDIAKIAVIPEMRGRGLGGALLDRILDDMGREGVTNVFLEVRESNDAARGLYRSRGFEEIGIRRRYYRNPGEDAVMMARKEAL